MVDEKTTRKKPDVAQVRILRWMMRKASRDGMQNDNWYGYMIRTKESHISMKDGGAADGG